MNWKSTDLHPSTIEMLARLVAIDTTSRNSNLDLISFVRAWLDAHNVPYRLSFDHTGLKANLHAIFGPVQPGGLAFSGHVDTVPVDGQTWTGDPFRLRRKEGKLIGRGTCDMKGFVAALVAAVPEIKARKLTSPVHLLLTYDEEAGYHGARRLVEDFDASGLRPATCVVGEASRMLPILAQKGRLMARVDVNGHATHSSEAHRGVNAIHAAAEAIAWLAAASRNLALQGATGAGFDPPYSTLQVSNIVCNALPNSVPGQVRFDVEWRNIPGDDPRHHLSRFQEYVTSTIQPQMRTQCPDTGFKCTVLLELAALSLSPQHELATAVCEVSQVQVGGKVSYCSEGSLYHPAGIACVVCGPGDVAQAHQPDEWIDESQLAACEKFIRQLVDRLAV